MTEHAVRPVHDAELYAACAEGRHSTCPAARANGIPVHGRCDCTCHAPLPPV